MKKLGILFFTLLVIYICFGMILEHFSKGYELMYSIYRKQDDITVYEKYVKNTKNEINHYDLTIQIGKETFEYRTLEKFSKKRIIVDVKYIKDKKYSCILPVFKEGQILTDILCKSKGNVYYNFQQIQNPSNTLRQFADTISNYQHRNYQDQVGKKRKEDLMTVYLNNIPETISFGVTNYKGIYLLNDQKVENIKLFQQDHYTRDLSTFVNSFYMTANYDETYDYKTFYLINLTNGDQKEIVSKTPIASDSYIAGVVNESIYIVDKSNHKQYELNVERDTIEEIGNETQGMKYYHEGKWEIVPSTRMTLKNTYFKLFQEYQDGDYHFFLKSEGNKSGYSYYYIKDQKNYKIYRAKSGNDKQKTYIGTILSLDKVRATCEYFFFQEKDQIKYYSDKTGIRTLVLDSELQFNQGLLYGAQKK